MKQLPIIVCLSGILLLVGCNREERLKITFQNPPLEYRMHQNIHSPSPDPAKQDSLIVYYLENGYGGFTTNVDFQHYLTDEGMKSFHAFCDKAKSKGLALWLYDEKGYPSGNAGDLVIKSNPSFESMGWYERDTVVTGGKVFFPLPPGDIVRAMAIPVYADSLAFAKATDLSKNIDKEQIRWDAPSGTWKILAVTRYQLYKHFQAEAKDAGKMGSHYPSLMLPEVTNKFIELTHETYAKYLGNDLGKYFVSTFTDEPSLMAVPYGTYPWSVIPWIGLLSDQIYARYGYRPEDKLDYLFLDAGPEGQKIRCQYFGTMGDLIARNYFLRIRDWCREHHVRSGGHLLLEETMMAHVPLYGNIFQCLQNMDAPGIDVLSCFPSKTPVHAPRLAASAANLSGADRVMCEPCPVADKIATGKEPPTDDVRGFLDIQLLGGVTDFNNYLELSNASEAEKKQVNDYVARINMMLRGGYIKADIAVVYPIETLWTQWIPKPVSVAGWDSVSGGYPGAIKVEQTFRNLSRFLYANRWEYLYVDSKALMDAKVNGSELAHGNQRWKVLILPDVNTLPLAAWKKIEQFVNNGGYLIALGSMPANSLTTYPDAAVLQIGNRIFQHKEKAIYLSTLNTKDLDHVLSQFIGKEIRLGDEKLPIRYSHRVVKGKDCFFVINDSENQVDTRLEFNTSKALTEWNPVTGVAQPVQKDIHLELKPFSGIIYRVR